MSRRKHINRKSHHKIPRRKLFMISAEGIKTEPQYFRSLSRRQSSSVKLVFPRPKHGGSPIRLLKAVENSLKDERLGSDDEAWIVVDKDQWTDEQLKQLHDWAEKHDNYGFALSNPKFEYWLLLHFEDGNKIASSRQCIDRLKRHLPNYDKGVNAQHITQEQVERAVERAKRRDNPPCTDWPRTLGVTTVYKLVENILKAAEE